MEIRDTRNGDWHWVSNMVLACGSISLADKAVYSALATFSGCQEIRPTFETIAQRCDVSVRTAKQSIKNLESSGFVEIVNHGKKGVANVYKLCKVNGGCVKKCKSCTTTKKCKSQQKEVQSTTKRSANPAPQIDKEIDKEVDNIAGASPALIVGLIDTFSEVNPAFEGWYKNKTQRAAVTDLIETHGFDRVRAVVENTLPKTNAIPYMPNITTPVQLRDKWAALGSAIQKKRNERGKQIIGL